MSRGYIALYRRIDCKPARAWAMERKYGGNTPPYFFILSRYQTATASPGEAGNC